MIPQKISPRIQTGAGRYPVLKRQALCGALALFATVGLSACDSSKKAGLEGKDGHSLALVKVNDVEISALQPAADLAPAEGRSSATKEAVKKQLLEMMIDRQLLQNEALRNNLERDPEVIQATERAKTEILAQAYLQSKFATVGTPDKAEVDAYFHAHPELFTERKTFYMKELVVATKDFSAQLKSTLDSAKSIDEVAAWLDKNQVRYERTQLSRSTADLAPEMITKLQAMRRNQLFVIKAGEYSMLDAIYEVRPSPVTAEAAAPQITHYLRNKKRKEIGDAELGRLRAAAKIEYLNKGQLASAPLPAAKLSGSPGAIQIESGVAGLK